MQDVLHVLRRDLVHQRVDALAQGVPGEALVLRAGLVLGRLLRHELGQAEGRHVHAWRRPGGRACSCSLQHAALLGPCSDQTHSVIVQAAADLLGCICRDFVGLRRLCHPHAILLPAGRQGWLSLTQTPSSSRKRDRWPHLPLFLVPASSSAMAAAARAQAAPATRTQLFHWLYLQPAARAQHRSTHCRPCSKGLTPSSRPWRQAEQDLRVADQPCDGRGRGRLRPGRAGEHCHQLVLALQERERPQAALLQAGPGEGYDVVRGGSVPGFVLQTSGGVARNIAEALSKLCRSGCLPPAAARSCKLLTLSRAGCRASRCHSSSPWSVEMQQATP